MIDSYAREKHRWGKGNNKVYTRKFHRKGRENIATDNNNNNKGYNAIAVVVGNGDATRNENDGVVQVSSSENLATDEVNLSPQQGLPQTQLQPRFQVVSDYSSCHNRPLPEHVATAENGNGVLQPAITRVSDDRVKINLGVVTSENEIQELRIKLVSELDQVRSLLKKLEAKELEISGYSNAAPAPAAFGCADYNRPQYLANVVSKGGDLMRGNLDVDSAGDHDLRPVRQLGVSALENSRGVNGELVGKEKRTPKASQYYRNSEFLLGKDRLPPESKKRKSNGGKKHGGKMDYGFGCARDGNQVFKICNNLLESLMKHKHGWVFNAPVDAKALGLNDYHDIIRHPMDLGTIKSRLAQNYYNSPREFAEDVRLTFRNAMTYNAKGQDVHIVGEQLLNIFEEKWKVIEAEYNPEWKYQTYQDVGLPFQTPTPRKLPPQTLLAPSLGTSGRSEAMTAPVDSKLKLSNSTPISRTPVPKKPQANDPNKRDMTYEEKQRLSMNLQSLPSEKLDNVVQIIKKRNSPLSHYDDEIEVDIDSVDAETLWELDRFVTNYRKNLSKKKRKAEIAFQVRAESNHQFPATNQAHGVLEEPKESKADDKNITAGTPVGGEKQRDNDNTSSSSSSSSNDSGSSSSGRC